MMEGMKVGREDLWIGRRGLGENKDIGGDIIMQGLLGETKCLI